MKPHHSRHHSRHHQHDDDGAFDENGTLRDGATFRVPVTMMDSMSCSVMRTYDGSGNRPGYRFADDFGLSNNQRKRQSAYALYDQQVSQAYLTPTGFTVTGLTGAGESGHLRGQQEGDTCTIDGNRGTLRTVNGKLVCVPDKSADAAPGLGNCPHCGGTDRCPSCDGVGDIDLDEEDNSLDWGVDDAECGRTDSRKAASDHHAKMAREYSTYDAELSTAWRK
jgi:hypothetical protein